MRTKPVIGVTGGIGAGKSSVARIFESLGAAVVDSDRLVHEQYRDPEVVATLCGWWGDGVCQPGGDVNRHFVAEIVFRNPAELARLESLLYPRIERRRFEMMEGLEQDASVRAVVLDVPKLFEAGVNRDCDAVIFVDTDRSVRLERLAKTRGWTEEELARREKLLNPLDKNKAMADHVLENHAGTDNLRLLVEQLFIKVLTAFSKQMI